MTDTKLRELERKWKESGSTDDEAAYLRARVQAGELSVDQVKLAAHCGHGASKVACAQLGETASADKKVLDWIDELLALGQDTAHRAIVAAARRALICWESDVTRAAIASEHMDSPRRAVQEAEAVLAGRTDSDKDLGPAGAALEAARLAWGQEGSSEWFAAAAALYALDTVTGEKDMDLWSVAVLHAVDAVGEAAVRAAVLEEVAPWALGYSDPVKDRVEARQRGDAGE